MLFYRNTVTAVSEKNSWNLPKKTIQVQNGKLLKIGIMEENIKLKQWYMQNGFLSTGTKRFAHLPFTVGFMEKRINL